ncbi:putative gustatory receptor 28a [Neodiprion virginianus]|uniref:putative gustatory receptor 28a isoform X2 n=1 Tax=Neodiprion fabricii TaxID=2872261 RepID=UPI001ED8F1ED|nr:putative gustatory receptor 28a isoform X2 [Neodiprion fabricii]XP_046610933.1 putative gustatory receptor 28a [Neodiprion virginianus]
MHVSRGVFDVESAVRKLSSRFRRHPAQVSRLEWPVISAVRSLFYFIRFIGHAPLEIRDDRFEPWSYGVFYSILCCTLHTYFFYIVLRKFTVIERNTPILDVTETAKVISNYSVLMLNILGSLWTRKQLVEVTNIMKQFDTRMRYLGYPLEERYVKVWVFFTFVFSFIAWAVIVETGIVAFRETFIENMIYILGYVTNSFSTIKFSGIVLLLGQRFRHLNEVAQRSKDSSMPVQKYPAVDFRVIHQLHNSLMNASESLSSQYSWPLLAWLISLCGHSVANLYFLIDWLVSTTESVNTRWSLVACIAWWVVVFGSQLLLLHIACHYTSSEANNIGSILFDWKSFAVSRSYRIESSLHLINRRLNFSAAGCFHVNLPLLRSITALLTTYLVLLLQFQA